MGVSTPGSVYLNGTLTSALGRALRYEAQLCVCALPDRQMLSNAVVRIVLFMLFYGISLFSFHFVMHIFDMLTCEKSKNTQVPIS